MPKGYTDRIKFQKRLFISIVSFLLTQTIQSVHAQKKSNYENEVHDFNIKITSEHRKVKDVRAALFRIENDQLYIYRNDLKKAEWYPIADIEEIHLVKGDDRNKNTILVSIIMGSVVGILTSLALTEKKSVNILFVIEIPYLKIPKWPLFAGPFAGLTNGIVKEKKPFNRKVIYTKEKGFVE
jgi:hypothetical protein